MNAITPDALQPQAPDAVSQAVAALEEDIVFGRLHPRERLTEDELMARFGMKRHAAVSYTHLTLPTKRIV